jgi:hypothetical protein
MPHLIKVRTSSGDDMYEESWVDESSVDAGLLVAYYSRSGLEALRSATDRRLKKQRADATQRGFLRKAMEDFSSLWNLLTPYERERTMALHSADSDLQVSLCGTHKESEQERTLHAQTAGVLCACLSSGTIVSVREIFGAESLSQRYFLVADLKALYPELDLIDHDDACHLHKFAAARASHSAHAASIAPPDFLYAIDGFHVSGHTDSWCLTNCHPDVPSFAGRLRGFRSSVCEFTFTWLSAFKHASKHMSEHSFKFFLLEMIDTHNDLVARGITDHLARAVRQRRP